MCASTTSLATVHMRCGSTRVGKLRRTVLLDHARSSILRQRDVNNRHVAWVPSLTSHCSSKDRKNICNWKCFQRFWPTEQVSVVKTPWKAMRVRLKEDKDYVWRLKFKGLLEFELEVYPDRSIQMTRSIS